MALGGAAWRNETRAWRRAMLKTPRPNTDTIQPFITAITYVNENLRRAYWCCTHSIVQIAR